jgi:hypothetical protein
VPLAIGILVFGAVMVQPTTILVAVFIAWASWQLFDCVRKGQINEHPLFSFTAARQEQQAASNMVAAAYAYPQQPPGGYPSPGSAPGPAYPQGQAYPPAPGSYPQARPPV